MAPVESFPLRSFDGAQIEAFLTLPLGRAAGSTHPMIVTMHGGPHAQQGPSFSLRSQVFAAQGYYHDYLAVEFGSYPHEGGRQP